MMARAKVRDRKMHRSSVATRCQTSTSRSPRLWVPVSMHDAEDHGHIVDDLEVHTERKPFKEGATDIAMDARKGFRLSADPIDDLIKGSHKLIAQPGPAFLIPEPCRLSL